jgi:hypothetical protein
MRRKNIYHTPAQIDEKISDRQAANHSEAKFTTTQARTEGEI